MILTSTSRIDVQLRNPFSYQNSEHSIIYNIIYVLIVSPFNKHFICSKPLGTNGVVQLVSLTSSIAQQTGMCNHNTIVDAKTFVSGIYLSVLRSWIISFIISCNLWLDPTPPTIKTWLLSTWAKARSVISTNILNKVSCKEKHKSSAVIGSPDSSSMSFVVCQTFLWLCYLWLPNT